MKEKTFDFKFWKNGFISVFKNEKVMVILNEEQFEITVEVRGKSENEQESIFFDNIGDN